MIAYSRRKRPLNWIVLINWSDEDGDALWITSKGKVSKSKPTIYEWLYSINKNMRPHFPVPALRESVTRELTPVKSE